MRAESSEQGPRLFWLAVLFAIALALRVSVVVYLGVPNAPDTPTYTTPAMSLVEGRGYSGSDGLPYLDRPPTYPLFLAAVFYLFGPGLKAVQYAQALLGALLAPWIACYVFRKFRSDRAATAAGLLWAIEPVALPVPAFILTEQLGSFLLFATVFFLDGSIESGSRKSLAAAGLAGAALALNTPIALLLLPCLLGAALVLRKLSLRACLWAAAAFVVLFSLWPLRNLVTTGKPVLVRSIGYGELIWYTTQYDFRWLPSPYEDDFRALKNEGEKMVEGLDTRERHRAFLHHALEYFKKHPLLVMKRVLKANFWFWIEVPGAMLLLKKNPAVRWPLLIYHDLRLLFALAGLFVGLFYMFGASFIPAATLIYFAVFLAPMMPIPRYYIPVLPMIEVVCAAGLMKLVFRENPGL